MRLLLSTLSLHNWNSVAVHYAGARAHAQELCADEMRDVVAGDSAGGNLSAAICLKFRDEGLRQPAMQILAYPVTDAVEGCGRESDACMQRDTIWIISIFWLITRRMPLQSKGNAVCFAAAGQNAQSPRPMLHDFG